MINRDLYRVIQARLAEKNPLIQVIIGPRQVGKTTALKVAIEKHGVYETADYPTPLPYTVIEEWWNKGRQNRQKILVIDEIQKIPGWSEMLKKLWDAHPHEIKIAVAGSSALLVEKGLRAYLINTF